MSEDHWTGQQRSNTCGQMAARGWQGLDLITDLQEQSVESLFPAPPPAATIYNAPDFNQIKAPSQLKLSSRERNFTNRWDTVINALI